MSSKPYTVFRQIRVGIKDSNSHYHGSETKHLTHHIRSISPFLAYQAVRDSLLLEHPDLSDLSPDDDAYNEALTRAIDSIQGLFEVYQGIHQTPPLVDPEFTFGEIGTPIEWRQTTPYHTGTTPDPSPLNTANAIHAHLEGSAHVIPDGDYCYTRDDQGNCVLCPYWAIETSKPKQLNGYCAFLKEGDWQSSGIGLIWDQCKACGQNIADDYE